MIFTLVLLGIMLPVPTRAGNHNIASWYGGGEKLNECTANGEIFNPTELTCASWDYPFGTMLKVTNTTSGRSVIVRVNDRGPNRRLGRAIDLTKAAFAEIAKLGEGLIFVEIEKI
ncbi:MAG: septal ring lytic transglycosylase RlpA family protein [Candidatus Omnitrophica bacterium]|nr:septal ring lytic transglycosylase RlpA family protein [Candidatus Omnitrophota bacterium]